MSGKGAGRAIYGQTTDPQSAAGPFYNTPHDPSRGTRARFDPAGHDLPVRRANTENGNRHARLEFRPVSSRTEIDPLGKHGHRFGADLLDRPDHLAGNIDPLRLRPACRS
ncbi:MAG: hypothetical protein DI589_08890 [Shinella sp.]|nr:MAG: hypothetical protein DI589_08890 [Shinella sp.]